MSHRHNGTEVCPFCGNPWLRHDPKQCNGFKPWPDQPRLRPLPTSTSRTLDLGDILQELERRP